MRGDLIPTVPIDLNKLPPPMYGPFGPTPPPPSSPTIIILRAIAIILGFAIPIIGLIIFLKRNIAKKLNSRKK